MSLFYNLNLMRSPIYHLESNIAAVAFNIAPEREADLAALRDKYGFEIHLVDEDEMGPESLLM